MRSLIRTAAAGRLAVLGLTLAALLAAAQPGQAMTWALLIGVEKYQNPDISPAENAANDPVLLSKTLGARGFVDPQRIRVLNDKSPDNLRPTRANIARLLASFPKNALKGDRLIVFFSGHGFRDKQSGKTYLAPIDCDPERLAQTGIELSLVRQALSESNAGSKFLILDACHSGNPRGGTVTFATAGEIKNALKDEAGIYTLASCEGDQKSFPTNNPKQPYGLFTFWLNMGLQGAADKDGNARITADELHDFVRPLVSKVSDGKQTPDRIVQAKAGDPEILGLVSEKDRPSMERLATQVHFLCKLHGINSLVIAPFSIFDPLQGREVLRGMVGPNLATKVQEKLTNTKEWNYKVIDVRTAARALQPKTGPQSVMDIDNLKAIKEKFGAGALLYGSLEPALALHVGYNVPSTAYKLNAKLISTDGTALGSLTALVDRPDDLPDLEGGSALVPRDQVIPPLDQVRNPEIRKWLNVELKRPHPLFDPDCPYGLEVRDESGRAKPLFYKKGDKTKLFVKVRRGERISLYLANRTGTTTSGGGAYSTPTTGGLNKKQDYNGDVFVRLWVDGLNVLEQKPDLPEEAWPWVMPPQSDLVIPGWHFYKRTTAGQWDFEVKPFKVVDAPNSVAYRKGYTQDIGQITAFFYAATEMNWLKTIYGIGQDENVRLRVLYPSYRPGEQFCLAYPLAWITIYYVNEDEGEKEVLAPVNVARK